MKKIALFSASLFCLSFISNAQITKGSLFLGGSFGAGSSSSKNEGQQTLESKSSGWNFRPQIGTAIADNKILGLSLGYGQSKQESIYPAPTPKQNMEGVNFSAGVFYRQYYPLSTRFFLFGEAGLDFGASQQEMNANNTLSQKTEGKSISLDVTPGIAYKASKKLFLEASLNRLASLSYMWSKSTFYPQFPSGQTTTGTNKSFDIMGNGSGFSNITIGLRWILPRK